MIDFSKTENKFGDFSDWEVGPSFVNLQTNSGENVECIVSPYFKEKQNILHIDSEQLGGVKYDIPTEGFLNLLISIKIDGKIVPVGALSIDFESLVPTIKMIQQTRAFRKIEEASDSDDERISFGPVFGKIEHPAQRYMRGDHKINWQLALLRKAEEIVKNANHKRIRLNSGFTSKYLDERHPLGLAIQQYDRLIIGDQDWVPFNFNGEPIVDVQKRRVLAAALRKLRDGAIKNLEEAKTLLSEEFIPLYYQKDL